MARLACYCGADMTDTKGPSPHLLNVFLRSEIDKALSYNPNICLWDLYTGWDELAECDNSFQNRSEPVEYWYCTECKRIYEVQAVSCGKILRCFKPVSDLTEEYSLEGYEELFILWDKEMDDIICKDRNYLLKDYIVKPSTIRFFISSDQKTIYGLDVPTNKLICKYILEES
jgi:hypothetical protein